MAWLIQTPYDIAGGVLVAHLLVIPTVPLLVRLLRKEEDRWVRRVVVGALVVKLFGTSARFAVAVSLYRGQQDALRYDRVGKLLAASFRRGDFADATAGRMGGTQVIEFLTGLLYTATGDTTLGGFIAYSWLGFWGLYLFYRAFRIALPSGEHRRYALLVFFLPSMVFWPSSIGKDAVMTFGLGMCAYGVASFVSHRRGGLLALIAGLVVTILVRPHITLTVVVSVIVAYLFTTARGPSMSAPLSKLAGLGALLLIFAFVMASFQSYFKLNDVSGGSVDAVLEKATQRSNQETSGSEFDPIAARSPLQLPLAVFSVLFRPLTSLSLK